MWEVGAAWEAWRSRTAHGGAKVEKHHQDHRRRGQAVLVQRIGGDGGHVGKSREHVNAQGRPAALR